VIDLDFGVYEAKDDELPYELVIANGVLGKHMSILYPLISSRLSTWLNFFRSIKGASAFQIASKPLSFRVLKTAVIFLIPLDISL
jgi:hypothetical protein